jgi:hypothetical protein
MYPNWIEKVIDHSIKLAIFDLTCSPVSDSKKVP